MGKEKIKKLEEIIPIVDNLKKEGKITVAISGSFDILHAGHVSYLEKAKEKNSILVVGLNSDSSVKKIKDKGRPVSPEMDRARVLAGLSAVDYVVIFREDTPIKLIRCLRPDCLVKGADWKGKAVVGEEVLKSYGGKLKLVRYLKKYSTTRTIQRILKSCPK